ncbi:PREDICTED: 15-hydroxyprostaglandin dehydrogenase [NAD(+)]-like [Nicrophorus vespilloides]|uniref:15-hydroxyprostaglandin dehydrogenase [NAD(+)]-like n=1 Tax=Nicrophorus vespilloides TaxID=110193 RepID=A0ABM1MPT7_NICVS|nr:PREDICTED: 15-hydroxyprostaglandin dehydrogenase [NAD(+)]-like [Nicrophorus vespilloides]
MSYNFNGKVALVTGGANGIGICMVRELLKNGVKGVVMADVNSTLGEKYSKELGDKVYFMKVDVTNKQQLESAFKMAFTKFGGLDIVCNNAGIFDEVNWEMTIAVNINAVVQGTLLGFQYMGKDKNGKGGVIVNTGSILGLQAIASGPVYSGTKHFVVNFDRAFGTPFYYDRTGVKVVTICPGITDTILLKQVKGLEAFDGLTKYANDQLMAMPLQPAENVARGMITAISQGENGSAWVAALNKPAYEEKAPKPTFV